jgi:hypothetical protein
MLLSAHEHVFEIEAAVDQLPQPEQEILLEHLARKLAARPPVTEGAQRERWLQKLDLLRNRGSTGIPAFLAIALKRPFSPMAF